MTLNSIIFSLLGGSLIGLSATLMWALHGRVAGISGILGLSVEPKTSAPERSWRLAFLLGLVAVGIPLAMMMPTHFGPQQPLRFALLASAGLLVGFGTRMGSGCTSGHGVCGLSRLSTRSFVATVVFVVAGVITVAVKRGLQ